jgi:TonB family protein
MTQLTHKTRSDRSMPRYQRNAESSWLWVALIGGSIGIHVLVAVLVLPFVGRTSSSQEAIAATPVDFIELPNQSSPELPPASSSSEEAIAPAPSAASNAASSSPPSSNGIGLISAVPSPSPPEPSPEPSVESSPEPSIEPSPEPSVEPSIEPPIEPSVEDSPSPEPTLPQETSNSPVPAEPSAADQSTTGSPTAELPEQSAASPTTETTATSLPDQQQAVNSIPQPSTPQPSASPFFTIPIDRAIPDVSETLTPAPESVDPSQLAQVETEQEAEPVRLTALLQVASVPAEELENPPDTIAQPKDTVDGISRYSFVADPTTSACLPNAEAVPSIEAETAVAVQVVTNEQGQVEEAILRQSSENPAYDDLVICLVENWEYQPAIAQGQPVASNALMVWVTVSRG